MATRLYSLCQIMNGIGVRVNTREKVEVIGLALWFE